jgi:hypothetical protein
LQSKSTAKKTATGLRKCQSFRGITAYGGSLDEAVARTEALALRVLAEGREHRTVGGIAEGHRWWFAMLLL